MSDQQATTEKRKGHRTTLTINPEMWDEVVEISKEKGVKPFVVLHWMLSDGIANYRLQREALAGAANGTKPKHRRKATGANQHARDGPHPLL